MFGATLILLTLAAACAVGIISLVSLFTPFGDSFLLFLLAVGLFVAGISMVAANFAQRSRSEAATTSAETQPLTQ